MPMSGIGSMVSRMAQGSKHLQAATPLSGETEPTYVTIGKKTSTIDVRLSYKIVHLFSEGLYASANKAVEELVANGFDAGARNVHVIFPADFHAPDPAIVVIDDGEGMDAAGLARHWLIGTSNKRDLKNPPLGRKQIGKFGIGKLATYVLARQLTHITKQNGKYSAVTMDYSRIDGDKSGGMDVKNPVKLSLRDLTEEETKKALEPWLSETMLGDWNVKFFGARAARSWTVAILSSLKDKANEIQPGRVEWLLRTALPLRDDFKVYLNGHLLASSKAGKDRLGHWVFGKDITKLPKPAAKMTVRKDASIKPVHEEHFGLHDAQVGRVTGYVEAYKDVLTGGKSDDIARSYGFFVYVRGRLINIDDEYFGIDSNLLRHGTFARLRIVTHIDKLDEELRSNREGVREGPMSKPRGTSFTA